MAGNISLRSSPRIKYLLLTLFFLLTEVYIGIFVHDKIIRPYFGDTLVVILLYCLLRSFIDGPTYRLTAFVVLFSFFIELLQYFEIADTLELQKGSIAYIMVGASFSFWDLAAYLLGGAGIIILERLFSVFNR